MRSKTSTPMQHPYKCGACGGLSIKAFKFRNTEHVKCDRCGKKELKYFDKKKFVEVRV